MQKDIRKHVRKCPTCQQLKLKTKKYGHLPEKEAECIPWEKLCVDLIGPYSIPNKSKPKEFRTLWCITMIDPVTGWVEIKDIDNKYAYNVANVVEITWLSRYSWPKVIYFDRGTEFMAEFSQMIRKDYDKKKKSITTRNPLANAIIEPIHQTIGNMLRTFQLYDRDDIDLDNPWSRFLAAIMFGLRATYHTTTQATPMQLVYNKFAIVNSKFQADWKFIKERKQKIIAVNNAKVNSKRLKQTYHVRDKIMLTSATGPKHRGSLYEDPYNILQVNQNGTVKIQKSRYTDIVNIRQISPYTEEEETLMHDHYRLSHDLNYISPHAS